MRSRGAAACGLEGKRETRLSVYLRVPSRIRNKHPSQTDLADTLVQTEHRAHTRTRAASLRSRRRDMRGLGRILRFGPRLLRYVVEHVGKAREGQVSTLSWQQPAVCCIKHFTPHLPLPHAHKPSPTPLTTPPHHLTGWRYTGIFVWTRR